MDLKKLYRSDGLNLRRSIQFIQKCFDRWIPARRSEKTDRKRHIFSLALAVFTQERIPADTQEVSQGSEGIAEEGNTGIGIISPGDRQGHDFQP